MKRLFHAVLFIFSSLAISAQGTWPGNLPNLVLWLRADTALTINSLTGHVAIWHDISGNHNDATAPSSTPIDSQPAVINDCSINNLAAISFNGTTNEFYGTTIGGLASSSLTIFIVAKGLSQPNCGTCYTSGFLTVGPRATGMWLYDKLLDDGYVFSNNYTPANGDVVDNAGVLPNAGYPFTILGLQKNYGVGVNTYINGLTALSNNTDPFLSGTFTNAPYKIANTNLIPGFYNLHGEIAEIIVFESALDSTQMAQINQYLFNRYTPKISLGPDIVQPYKVCADTLDAGCAFINYLWSTGEITSKIIVKHSGTYSVTVTDGFGNVSSDTINVTMPNLTLNQNQNSAICTGSSLNLATQFGALSGYTFLWSNNATTPSITVSTAGNYFVKLTDTAGCFNYSDTVKATIDNFSTTVSLNPAITSCTGNTIGLSSPTTGWANLQFNWSNGQTDSLATLSAAGNYCVTVTDQNNCSASICTSVTILGIAPTLKFTGDTLCYGQPFAPVNTSTPGTDTWYFGDGDSSNLTSPSYNYTSPGVFNVRLNVYTGSNGCSNSLTQPVRVYALPNAGFTGSPGCTPSSFQFTDASVAPAGDSIVQWQWNFGDGGTGNTQNPLHQYPSSTTYTVTLVVTDKAGCSGTVTKNIDFSGVIVPRPVSLTLPGNGAVFQSAPVVFAWNPVPGVLSYSLEISTDPNFITSNYYGGLTVTQDTILSLPGSTTYYWQVIAEYPCSDSSVSVTDSFSLFSVSTGCLSLWLRADSVALVAGGDSVQTWYDASGFGYNTTGPLPTALGKDSMPTWIAHDPALNNMPSISFSNSHAVHDNWQEFYGPKISGLSSSSLTTFIVSSGYATTSQYTEGMFSVGSDRTMGMLLYRRCFDTQDYTMDNGTGTADFLYGAANTTPNTGYPYKVFEMVKNINIADTLFINGQNSGDTTDPGMTAPFSTDAPYFIGNTYFNNIAGFNNLHGKIAEVIVYNCALNDAERQQVENYLYTRYAPPVYLGPDIVQHNLCPDTLKAGSGFVSYKWSTGDSVHAQIVVYQTGTYSVTVTDIFGRVSIDSINISLPFLGTDPPADTAICLGFPATLKQLLTTPSLFTYHWNTASTVDTINVTTPGNYLCTVSDGICSFVDTIKVKIDSFSLINPLPADTLICGGSSPAVYTAGHAISSYLWSPGGSTSPAPAFDTAGAYAVTVTDITGCTATGSSNVTVHFQAPVTDFTASSFCYGLDTHLSDLSVAAGGDSIDSLIWLIPGASPDTSFIQNPIVKYAAVGTAVVSLFVSTTNGCTGLKTDSVTINASPGAAFTYTGTNSSASYASVLCAGDNTYAILHDITIPGLSTDSITALTWLVDGVVDASLYTDTIILYPFTAPGNYTVTLMVTNEKGCSDTTTVPIQVFPPLIADFAYQDICFGDTTQFSDLTHTFSIVSWDWDFGDASSAVVANPTHYYQAPGPYQVTLSVENAIGCIDHISENVEVVQNPIANFVDTTACANQIFAPSDSSKAFDDPITQWQWQIAGNTYNTHAPHIMLADTGTFSAKLKITTHDGCTDSISKTIVIYPSPLASFTFSPQYGTAPIDISFNNTSKGAGSYVWFFGDGTVDAADTSPVYNYTQNNTYNVVLYAYNSEGCLDSAVHAVSIIPTCLDISVTQLFTTQAPQSDGTVFVGVIAQVCNQCTRLITSSDFLVTIGSGGTFIQSWAGNLPAGECMIDTIPVAFVESPANASSFVCFTAQNVNNGQTETQYDNNEVCVSLTGAMQLAGPSPNPAVSQSTLGIIMPQAGTVTIDIFDELGHYIAKGISLNLPVGRTDYQLPVTQWNGAEYYIRITYNGDTEVRELITR